MDDATFQKLRADLLDGSLAPEASAEVLEHLRSHPEVLDELGRSLAIDRLLGLAIEPAGQAGQFSKEVEQRIQTAPQAEVFARSVRQRIKPKAKPVPWIKVALPLAAALVLLAVGTMLLGRPDPMARIASTQDVEWATETRWAVGDTLDAGQSISIDAGLLALSLPGRGTVVLDGKTQLQVRAEKEFTMAYGRATFSVSEGGKGLTVTTAHGTVVDIGTAFALEVTTESMELHVLEGEVVFTNAIDEDRSLLAGDSLRSSPTSTADIPSRADQFVRYLPEPDDSRTHVCWSCQEGYGTSSAANGAASPAPLRLRSAFPDGRQPTWTSAEGRSGLAFDGSEAYAQTDYSGVLGNEARTVALWVRVPESWTPADGGTLVSWGRSDWKSPGHLFEVTLNRDAAKGPLGAPQLDTYGHSTTATQSLTDGRWHHLAVTTYPGPEGSASTQVLFHLDGRLLASAPRSLPALDTVKSRGGRGVVVGRSIQGITSPEPPAEAFFPGLVSELVIAEKALDSQEIRSLMATGNPW